MSPMGAVRLELRCPQQVHGIALDPEPNWNFDSLLSELNSLETEHYASSTVPIPFVKTNPRDLSNGQTVNRRGKAFVMRVSDDDGAEDFEIEGGDLNHQSIVVKRFHCDDLYLSDESDSELGFEEQSDLMDRMGVVEGSLFELNHDYQLGIKEEIRNQTLELVAELTRESEKSSSAFARVDKYRQARQEMDRKLDTQYQRKIAEALDNHLTAVQRDHELRSQMEERRIRSEAAHEEAKRKEKALKEEKLRQEKAKAEAEAKHRAEETRLAALEAERRVAKEAAEKEAAEASKRGTSLSEVKASGHQVDSRSGNSNPENRGSGSTRSKQSTGNIVKAADSALLLEQGRFQKLKELDERNQSLISNSNSDFSRYEGLIARLIRQIRGTKENVSVKQSELVNIMNNPLCPQSISVATFAKKIVSRCQSPDDSTAFACARVIVHVVSKVPQALDPILAEFHRACIYTVPKHLFNSETAFKSKEAYYKAIGYCENDGKIESSKDYLRRLESYMKLYGALVQTEVEGVQNPHGIKEGWAWLARFLNCLPANMYTGVALNAFLQTAGFSLFRNYKSQFRKLLRIISDHFLNALRARNDSDMNLLISNISVYIEDSKFLQEPEGRSLQQDLLSSKWMP
ncbi:nucleoporin GLE1-like isoform X2 [Tripterygium wilfordii]|uniref:mRNA export factor GLE1 n=1 Tax=Tripterygium wilfordii TaxID=458696 RepID=A0A7J7DJW9_TRIWF|nr:protein GLE1 [Tripterygium wilfordii]KAF5746534.1 nucleoporin GLE1-like isoform X2 [Tripterygium wilfordii]